MSGCRDQPSACTIVFPLHRMKVMVNEAQPAVKLWQAVKDVSVKTEKSQQRGDPIGAQRPALDCPQFGGPVGAKRALHQTL